MACSHAASITPATPSPRTRSGNGAQARPDRSVSRSDPVTKVICEGCPSIGLSCLLPVTTLKDGARRRSAVSRRRRCSWLRVCVPGQASHRRGRTGVHARHRPPGRSRRETLQAAGTTGRRPSRAASSPVCISFTREISSAGQSVARTRSSRAKGGSGEFSCPMHTQWSDHAHVEDGVPGQGRS